MSSFRTRRLLALAPVVALVTAGAAACSSASSSSSSAAVPRRPQPPPRRRFRRLRLTPPALVRLAAKHYTIAYVPGATGVAFYDTLVAGMKAKAAALGMSVIYQGSPNFAPASQTPVVDAICTEHPSVLIVSPTDPVAMAPAISTCLSAGIPVITTDTGLTNTSQLTSAITTDNDSGGKDAADFVGKALGGKGEVALLSLSPTATTQVERIASFEKEIKAAYPGITVLPVQFTAQATSDSETVARSILAAHPGVKAFFGSAEPNAEGTAAALKALGLTGKVINVGFDSHRPDRGYRACSNRAESRPSSPSRRRKEGADAARPVAPPSKITGDTSGITASVQLPDVLITAADAAQPGYATYLLRP